MLYFDINKLKRIKVSTEFDTIVKNLGIKLDIETITDKEIKKIALQINARKTIILDSMFIWFKIKLGIEEN